ncbi:MAG TPA: DUF6402 family protein [Kaistia sp.]|jgi:uncharacterized Zn-binding protein involved in type VI secretion|nr:DUF6402 family protein [Kaistia sp.]
MTRGIAVRNLDAAGGRQLAPNTSWFRVEQHAVVTKGDPVNGHGDGTHAAPVMVEGEDWFRIAAQPASRAGHLASCGHDTSGRSWFRLTRELLERDYLGPCDPDICNVEHIPHIMRARGWTTGARLMDQWFNNPPGTDRDAVPADVTTIRMDWVLSFSWARPAYAAAIDLRLWMHARALEEITKWLDKSGKFKPWPTRFGSFQRDMKEIHKDYVTHQAVTVPYEAGLSSEFWDDLTASLGAFVFHFVVTGRVEPDQKGYWVHIDRVGVYVRDSYDFQNESEEDQPLGYWKKPDYASPRSGGCVTFNSTFQAWRKIYKRGGDYYIFSDVKILKVDDVFFVGPAPGYSVMLPPR